MIKSGTKKIYGEVELVDCFELSLEKYNDYYMDMYGKKENRLPYKRTFAWVVKNPVIYEIPKDYKHPLGAIIWVNL